MKHSVEREVAGETEVLGKNPASVPLCPSQIQHDLSWDLTGRDVYELSLMLIWKYVWLCYVQIFCRMSRLAYELAQ
jgi:hypothetical protein